MEKTIKGFETELYADYFYKKLSDYFVYLKQKRKSVH